MTRKIKLTPEQQNTFDYDPNNPDHAHIKKAIGQRMIVGYVKEGIRETAPKPSLRTKLLRDL